MNKYDFTNLFEKSFFIFDPRTSDSDSYWVSALFAIQYKLRVGPEKWTRLGNTNVLRLPVGQRKIGVWQNQTYKEDKF